MQVFWLVLLQHAPPVLWLQWEEMPWMTVEPEFISILLGKGILQCEYTTRLLAHDTAGGQEQNRHRDDMPDKDFSI